jgi:hypothetical protein
MAELDPAIHVFLTSFSEKEVVDARVKPGHDASYMGRAANNGPSL